MFADKFQRIHASRYLPAMRILSRRAAGRTHQE